MIKSRLQTIKQARKEALILRELASCFIKIAQDNPELEEFCIVRVKLSDRKGFATIFVSCAGGKEEFDKKINTLILYKPSLRKHLSNALHWPYCPDFAFEYDTPLEKQRSVEALIDSLKEQGKL